MADYVRRMRIEDIGDVTEIDREAFPTEWPPPNFKRELENRLAHYLVSCQADGLIKETAEDNPPEKMLERLLSSARRLFSARQYPASRRRTDGPEEITGFTGLWMMADEAHITSIATREAFRRQGLGELLLQSAIGLSTQLQARIITLEVRVSNTVAQTLYTKYGFSQVGLRRAYYTDNREDAMLMTTDHLTSASFQALLKELKEAYQAKWGAGRYQLGH